MSLLTFSGFEANGFAGLLKDTYVASAFGLAASAISSCQTAQSPNSLKATVPTSLPVLSAQLESLAVEPKVVKIGLVPNIEVARCMANFIAQLKEKPFIVLDPVDTSSSDGTAFSQESLATRIAPLLPHVSLLTPNSIELQQLISQNVLMQSEGGFIAPYPNLDILVKGGHQKTPEQTITDKLFNSEGKPLAAWQQTRVNGSARGTGCFLSTAIASCVALGYSIFDAITLANASLNKSLRTQQTCHGIPKATKYFPKVVRPNVVSENSTSFAELGRRIGLYPVVDSAKWIERLAQTGITTIQLRLKNKTEVELKNEISRAIAIAKQHHLQLFINDYWQLAIELGAYGVHLGQEDLESADLKAIQEAGSRLGISTHGDFEFILAQQLKPSYLAVGAIYPTKTKDMTGQIQGTERLKRFVKRAGSTPVVAIGGINNETLNDVLCTGVDMVAVVSAVTKAKNPIDAATVMNEQVVRQSAYKTHAPSLLSEPQGVKVMNCYGFDA